MTRGRESSAASEGAFRAIRSRFDERGDLGCLALEDADVSGWDRSQALMSQITSSYL